MENNTLQLQVRRGLRTSVIIMIVCSGTLIGVTKNSEIRNVDTLALMAAGMGIGIFFTLLLFTFKLKRQNKPA